MVSRLCFRGELATVRPLHEVLIPPEHFDADRELWSVCQPLV